MTDMREPIIRDYISKIDFKKGNWSNKQIKSDLKNLIGEEPGIKVNYTKDAVLNEINSEATEVTILDSLEIIYSPNMNNTVRRLTFKIGKNNNL